MARIFVVCLLLFLPFAVSFRFESDLKVDSVELSLGIEDFSTSFSVGNYGYYGTSSTPGYIVKVDLSTFTRVGYIRFNTTILSSIVSGEFAYFGTGLNYIVKLNLANFTVAGTAVTSITELSTVIAIGDTGYFANRYGGSIVKFNITSFTQVDSVRMNGNYYQIDWAFVYSGYGFFVVRSSSVIFKTNLTTFSIIGNITASTANFNIKCGVIKGNIGYFGTSDGVIQVNLDTLQVLDSIVTDVAITSAVQVGDIVYFAGVYTYPVNITSFKIVGTRETFSTIGDYVTTGFLNNNYMYFGVTTSPAQIFKLDVNGSIVDKLLVDSLTTYLGSAITYGNYVYWSAGTRAFDNKILKLSINNFTIVDEITVTNQGFISSFVYGNALYFGDSVSWIVRIDPNTSLTNSLYLPGQAFSAIVYGSNAFLALGNGRISKISLSTFSLNSTILVGTSIRTASIAGKYGYFGSEEAILKVDLDTFTVVSNITVGKGLGYSFVVGNYAYFFTTQYSQTTAYKIDLNNFSLESSFVYSYAVTSIIYYNGYVYAGTDKGLIAEIDVQSWTNVTIQGPKTNLQSVVFYQNALYFGSYSAVAAITKVDFSNSTDISTSTSSETLSSTTSSTSSSSTTTTSSASTTSQNTGTINDTSSTDSITISPTGATTDIISTTSNNQTDYSSLNSSPTSNSINIGAIVGIIIAVLVVVAIVAIAFIFILKKRKQKPHRDEELQETKPRPQSVELELSTLPTVKGVVVKNELGSGNFGAVYRGEWNGSNVALKMLKASLDDQHTIKAFIKECNLLHKLSHPNIVQFMGIFTNTKKETFLVTEVLPTFDPINLQFMTKGDLLSMIRTNPDITVKIMIDMARQAAAGMAYLHSMNIIHRDLALRNLLVTLSDNRYIIKVADFGLSSSIGDYSEYKQKPGTQVPFKWSAPEVVKYATVTTKSDVWSYGVCLWELFTRGEIPYAPLTDPQVIMNKIYDGYRLPQPTECPTDIYKLMLNCWDANANERKNFDEIINSLENILPTNDYQVTGINVVDNSVNLAQEYNT